MEPYTIKLAHGGELKLKYTFKSLRWMEKMFGGHFFSDTLRNLGADYLSAGIAAGLLWQHADMTPAKVDAVIEKHLEAGGNLPQLLDDLIEAFKAAGIMRRPEGEPVSQPNERPTTAEAPGVR